MKKKHKTILDRITASIPKELLDKLMKMVKPQATIKLVLEKAVKDKKIDADKRRQYQNLLDSGELDKEVEEVDREVEKQIDAYLDAEIKKSIKKGELPRPPKKLKWENKKSSKDLLRNTKTK